MIQHPHPIKTPGAARLKRTGAVFSDKLSLDPANTADGPIQVGTALLAADEPTTEAGRVPAQSAAPSPSPPPPSPRPMADVRSGHVGTKEQRLMATADPVPL